jgi:hypothetical protein
MIFQIKTIRFCPFVSKNGYSGSPFKKNHWKSLVKGGKKQEKFPIFPPFRLPFKIKPFKLSEKGEEIR